MDIEVLTRPNAIPILFYLRDCPGVSKTTVIKGCSGACQKTTFIRITELMDSGYIEDDGQTYTKNVQKIHLTDKGKVAVSLLDSIRHL